MLKKLCILMAVIMSFALVGCSESDKFADQRGSDDDMQFLEMETEDMVDTSLFIWGVRGWNYSYIILKHSDENAIFECTVNRGSFVLERHDTSPFTREYFKSLVLKSGDGLPFHIKQDNGICCYPAFYWCDKDGFSWWPWEFGPDGQRLLHELEDKIRQAFVEIVLKIDNNIVGYAVVEIYSPNVSGHPHGYGHVYEARVLKSALFPKIDGEYQNVTQENVKKIIEKIKNK